MPIGQQTPTRVVPANGLSAGWPFCSRPDPDGRWSVWLVAVSTGTAGRGGGRREGGGERQTTRPEGERFSWPVTPVTVLPFSFSSLSAGAMTAFLCQFAICFTCNDSVSFLYSEVEGWTVRATAHADLSPYFYLYFPNVLKKKAKKKAICLVPQWPTLSFQRCLGTISLAEREREQKSEDAWKCSKMLWNAVMNILDIKDHSPSLHLPGSVLQTALLKSSDGG